jgi:hypothetical protein
MKFIYFNIEKYRNTLFWIFTILASFLYIVVAYKSKGYDDEFYNISLIEKYGYDSISITQNSDVHPPLSYLLNSLFYNIFNNWQIVRVISSLFFITSVLYYALSIKKTNSFRSILVLILFFSNPGFLMWCTSIRWYSYYIPILIWLLVIPKKNLILIWIKFIIGIIILSYIGYATFLLAPVLTILYINHSKNLIKYKRIYFLFSILFIIILYIPQFNIFLNFHLPNRFTQTANLIKNISGVLISQFSNQGVFPLSIYGLLSSIGLLLVSFSIIISNKFSILKDTKFIVYFTGIILFIINGLAYKFRNLICLTPFQLAWISSPKPYKNKPFLYGLGLLLIISINIVGVINVYSHNNTTKNSWDMPINETLSLINKLNINKLKNVGIFVNDPALIYYLKNNKNIVIFNFNSDFEKIDKFIQFETFLIINTYTGLNYESDNKFIIKNANKLRNKFKYLTNFKLSEDRYFKLKKKVDKNYPQYRININFFHN